VPDMVFMTSASGWGKTSAATGRPTIICIRLRYTARKLISSFQNARHGEAVSKLRIEKKSCHDINAEMDSSRRRNAYAIRGGSRQPLIGAGLKPAPTLHRATILADWVILRQSHLAGHSYWHIENG
jgi:hypothetical protein